MKNFLWRNDIRLHKYLSICGVASRRKSEKFIEEGRVKVNGQIIDKMGYVINQNDRVEVDNKLVTPEKKVYIVLNKPVGYLCTNDDGYDRKTIYDLIKIKDLKLFSLGRLDKDTGGLIILTNDGNFANSIIHPSNNIVKEYIVETSGKVPQELAYNFKKGITIENIVYKAEDVVITGKENILKIFLKEGKKREIREVFKYYSVRIKSLKRVALGGLRLEDMNLKEGKYIFFEHDEIINLIKNGRKGE